MVGLDELDTESPKIDGLSVTDHLTFLTSGQVMLLQLVVNEPDRQFRSVHGHVQLFEDIGKGSDMILMTVGDDETFHPICIVLQIGDVRDHQVNSQHIILRKGQAAVHHNNTVLIFKGSNIHADLLQAAQRYDLQF